MLCHLCPLPLGPQTQSLCYVFSLFVCSLTYEVLSRLCLSLHHWKRYVCLSSFDRRWIFNWLAWQSMARVHWLILRFADHSIFLCLPSSLSIDVTASRLGIGHLPLELRFLWKKLLCSVFCWLLQMYGGGVRTKLDILLQLISLNFNIDIV